MKHLLTAALLSAALFVTPTQAAPPAQAQGQGKAQAQAGVIGMFQRAIQAGAQQGHGLENAARHANPHAQKGLEQAMKNKAKPHGKR